MASKTTALVPDEAPKSLLPIPAAEVNEILASALAPGERLDVTDLPIIKVPTAGGLYWTPPDGPPVATLTGIIVVRQPTRSYWSSPFAEGGGGPPDCASPDAVTGTGNPGGACDLCPMQEYGSGKDNAQACRLNTQVFLLQEGNILPTLVSLPPSAFRICKRYMGGLATRALKMWDVRTEIKLVKTKSDGGIEYSVPEFKTVQVLDREQRAEMAAYRVALLPVITAAVAAAPAEAV